MASKLETMAAFAGALEFDARMTAACDRVREQEYVKHSSTKGKSSRKQKRKAQQKARRRNR